jgi:hypothetical protein
MFIRKLLDPQGIAIPQLNLPQVAYQMFALRQEPAGGCEMPRRPKFRMFIRKLLDPQGIAISH